MTGIAVHHNEWIFLVVGCALLGAVAIQFFLGGAAINGGLWMTWIRREDQPKLFWTFIIIEAFAGAMLSLGAALKIACR